MRCGLAGFKHILPMQTIHAETSLSSPLLDDWQIEKNISCQAAIFT